MKSYISVLSIFTLSLSLFAAEADHYSKADTPLADASQLINFKANEFLRQGLEALNEKGECSDSVESELELYEELRNYFANHSQGKLVIDILHDGTIPLRVIPKGESIYGDWKIGDGFLLGRPGAEKSQLGLMPLVRIGEVYIGVDKLEHMFGMGLIYHKRHNVKGDSLTDVLKNGIFREKTVLGGNMIATGIFSYGDLSANFNGMRFWNHMLLKRTDVLGISHNLGPYVKCEAGKWKPTLTEIDFRNYIDYSMDESVNCRKLATRGGVEKSKQAMVARGIGVDACPNNSGVLNLMYSKYNIPVIGDSKGRTISHWIINLEGLGKVKYFGEFKK